MKINIIEEDHTYSISFGIELPVNEFPTIIYGEYEHNWAKGYTVDPVRFMAFCVRNRKNARIKISQEAERKIKTLHDYTYEFLPFEITVKPNGNILELDFSMFD